MYEREEEGLKRVGEFGDCLWGRERVRDRELEWQEETAWKSGEEWD